MIVSHGIGSVTNLKSFEQLAQDIWTKKLRAYIDAQTSHRELSMPTVGYQRKSPLKS